MGGRELLQHKANQLWMQMVERCSSSSGLQLDPVHSQGAPLSKLPSWDGAISAKPAHLLVWGEGQDRQGKGISGCWEEAQRAPSSTLSGAPHQHPPPLASARVTWHEAGAALRPCCCPGACSPKQQQGSCRQQLGQSSAAANY